MNANAFKIQLAIGYIIVINYSFLKKVPLSDRWSFYGAYIIYPMLCLGSGDPLNVGAQIAKPEIDLLISPVDLFDI